jgi:uncharacterized protein YndB with AHSA1/START domain
MQGLRIALLIGAMATALPAQAIAAGPVATATRVETDGTTTMTHETLIDAPMADVWAAISTPEGWKSWAVPTAWLSPADPDILETSYDPRDKPGSPGTIQQRFTARIPGRLLAFRTIKAPQGFPHWETYSKVSSVFELEPAGQQTRLRLTSTGYPDTEAGRALIAFFTQGNSETLKALQKRFEQ